MSPAQIAFTRLGEGDPPFVLVHGFAGARDDWALQTVHLSRRHTTVAVELGGHGASPAQPAHGRIQRHGEDVAALVTDLGLPPAVLVGHSMGCRVALQTAVTVPALVAGLVLLDGSWLGGGAPGPAGLLVTAESYEEVVGPVVEAMDPYGGEPSAVARMVSRALAMPHDVGASLFGDIRRWDAVHAENLLRRLDVPLLLVQSTVQDDHGRRRSLSHGEVTPYLELVRRAVPGVRVVTVHGAGHYPHHEQPELVNEALLGFAAEIGGRARDGTSR